MSANAHEIARWVEQHSEPFALDGGIAGLPNGGSIAQADVLGIAATTRLTGELTVAAHVLIRAAVEDHGFRAVLIEGTDGEYATGSALDRYVTAGEGDPVALLRASQGFLHTQETLDLVEWLRNWSAEHPDDPVRVVHGSGREPVPTDLAGIENELAGLSLGWLERTGQRIVHWGGTAHLVAAAPRLLGEAPLEKGAAAGHRLRAALGARYALLVLTFGGGELLGNPVLPAGPDLVESAFEGVPGRAFQLDLAELAHAPADVVAWWRHTLRTRCVGSVYGSGNAADTWVGIPEPGPLADGFVHVAKVGPPRFLASV
jgi:erythromycin esterase